MTTQDKEAVESTEAMKQAWLDFQSQDNEGYRPERGSFKCGWFEGILWYKKWIHKQREKPVNGELEGDDCLLQLDRQKSRGVVA